MPNVTIQDSEQIVQNALVVLQNNTSITNISQGTLARAIVRATSDIIGKEYDSLTTEVALTFIRTSSGSALDLIGELVGTPRGGSSVSSRVSAQKFYSSDGLTPIQNLAGAGTLGGSIPGGTIVQTSNGSIQYQTLGQTSFGPTDTFVIATVAALNSGTVANVGANALTVHNLNVTGLLTTNLVDITSGSNTQGDTEYKEFLARAVTAAEAANPTAVRLAALSVGNVSDAIITRYYYGVGTFSILVTGTTPIVSSDTLNAVATAVNKIASAGEFFTVRPPRYVGVEVDATITFAPNVSATDRASIASQAINTIYDYINNLPLGQGFVRNEIIQRIMDISPQVLDVDDDDTSPNQLAIYVWTPTIVDIAADGTITTNRVRQEIVRNYAPFSDDKMVIEQDIQGFTHEAGFNPVNIT